MRVPASQFAARTKDGAALSASSSGGVFTEFARTVFSMGGVVVGVGWEKNPFRAVHKVARSENELAEMRGAKYVFSDMAKCLSEVDSALKEGKSVLFTGTPCQTAAMRKKYGCLDNLMLCAIICHSAPERDVWAAYIEELEGNAKSKIVNMRFRDKRSGWRKNQFVVDFENPSRRIVEPLDKNVYMHAFFTGLSARRVCSKCPFRCGENGADIMIGDFWGIEDCHPEWDDDKGVSAVLVYSEKGESLLRSSALDLISVSYGQVLAKNPHIEKSPVPDEARRVRFMSLYRKVGIAHAFCMALQDPLYRRIPRYCVRMARRLLHLG